MTYRLGVVSAVSSRQGDSSRQLGGAAASDSNLVTCGIELCELAVRVGPLQAQNLVTKDVLPWSNGGWQGHWPGAVLQREPLTSPRSGGLFRVVAGLVNLDPDIACAAVELAAWAIAVGQVGHDFIELVSQTPNKTKEKGSGVCKE